MTVERWTRAAAAGLVMLLVAALAACAPESDTRLSPRSTLFIGIDVSQSFQNDGRYDDAMAFASHYIYGHLNGKAELEEPRALFVGSIGGETPGQPQAFHPIHDFEGKTPAEIEADLREWFAPDDRYTDFNAFFQRAASLVQRQNLVLAPITLVLFTDGLPDVGRQDTEAEGADRYARVDVDPLEYLARNVTLRVLYPDPTVAVHWERDVPRDRVRVWTVDHVVMRGWRDQLREPEQEPVGGQIAAATPAELDAADADAAGDSAAVDAGAGDPESADPESGEAGDESSSASSETAERDTADAEDDSRPVYRDPRVADPTGPGEVRGVAMPGAEVVPEQPELWRWIQDNVDFRVGRRIF